MSVLKSQRGTGRFEVITKAIALADYTITICKNEKNFPKRDRWIITQKIVNLAIDIVADIRKANDVHVVEPSDYYYRRQLQIQARANCEALLTLIDISYRNLHLESDRVEYWTGLVVHVENLLSKWRESDRKRYGKNLKGNP